MDYTDRSASEVTAACAALLRSMRDPDAAASALGGLAAAIRRAPPDAADLALLPVSLFFDDQLAAKAAARPKERVLIAALDAVAALIARSAAAGPASLPWLAAILSPPGKEGTPFAFPEEVRIAAANALASAFATPAGSAAMAAAPDRADVANRPNPSTNPSTPSFAPEHVGCLISHLLAACRDAARRGASGSRDVVRSHLAALFAAVHFLSAPPRQPTLAFFLPGIATQLGYMLSRAAGTPSGRGGVGAGVGAAAPWGMGEYSVANEPGPLPSVGPMANSTCVVLALSCLETAVETCLGGGEGEGEGEGGEEEEEGEEESEEEEEEEEEE